MKERSEFELLTTSELRRVIAHTIGGSALDQAAFVEMASPGVKRGLMEKWDKGGPLSKLDLQRVLRIVRELEDKHG